MDVMPLYPLFDMARPYQFPYLHHHTAGSHGFLSAWWGSPAMVFAMISRRFLAIWHVKRAFRRLDGACSDMLGGPNVHSAWWSQLFGRFEKSWTKMIPELQLYLAWGDSEVIETVLTLKPPSGFWFAVPEGEPTTATKKIEMEQGFQKCSNGSCSTKSVLQGFLKSLQFSISMGQVGWCLLFHIWFQDVSCAFLACVSLPGRVGSNSKFSARPYRDILQSLKPRCQRARPKKMWERHGSCHVLSQMVPRKSGAFPWPISHSSLGSWHRVA